MIQLGNYYTYKELSEQIRDLVFRFHSQIQLKNMGTTRQQRQIHMLVLGDGPRRIMVTAGVHGRENINPAVLLKMAEYYCEQKKLEGFSIAMLPLVNPDGYEKAGNGFPQWKNNGRDIDINRNFPSRLWGKKTPGDMAGSEKETIAVIDAFRQFQPELYLDYHSRGESIYYYRSAMGEAYNKEQRRLAEILAAETGYKLEAPENEIDAADTGGNTVHYFSEQFQKPALTIETVPEEIPFPMPPVLQEKVWKEIKETPLIG